MADPSIGSKRPAAAEERPEPKKARIYRVVRVVEVTTGQVGDEIYDCTIPRAYLKAAHVKRNSIFSCLTPKDTVERLKKDAKHDKYARFKLALLEQLLRLRRERMKGDALVCCAFDEAEKRSTSHPPAYCTVYMYMGY